MDFSEDGHCGHLFLFFLGIFAARRIMKLRPSLKAILDGILTLPMVLPPTVAGFFLLLLFSKRRPFGMFLFDTFGIKVVQSWLGCIIAATVIAFPSCTGMPGRPSSSSMRTWFTRDGPWA